MTINKVMKTTTMSLLGVLMVLMIAVSPFSVNAAELGDEGIGDIGGFADYYDMYSVDNVDYYDMYGQDNVDYYDMYGDYNTDYYDVYGDDNTDYYDIYGDDNADYYDVYGDDDYSYGGDSYGGGSYGGGSYGGGSYGGGGYSYTPSYSYTPPRTQSYPVYTTPTTFYAPTYTAPKHTPAVTPSNTTVVNNNTNHNVNNNVNTATAIASVTNVIQQAPAAVPYVPQYTQPVVHPQPYCTISISNNNAYNYNNNYNQAVTLTWSSQNTTSGYISPSVGSVSGYGSMTVYPTNGQMYTMTVYGQGGSATCYTSAFHQPVYTPPVNPTPYVSLSQIPYTGLDLGPVGTAMYWLSLMVFAGAAAYLVLYYQGGMLAFAGSFASKKTVAFETPRVAVAASAPVAVKSPIQVAIARVATDSMNMVRDAQGTPRLVISRS